MEYREMLHRYVGRRVCVSTFGHSKLWGDLAAVNEDCLRLVNTQFSSDGEDQWNSQSYSDPDSSYGVRHAETIVHFHHIVAITCLDDDIPEPLSTAAEENAVGDSGDRSSRSAGEDFERDHTGGIYQQLGTERLEVLIGRGLIRLVDPKLSGGITERIIAIRSTLASQLGFVLPSARLRDDARLGEHEYRIVVNGSEVARGQVRPDKLLAVGGKQTTEVLAGERTLEPVFAQPAMWIDPNERPVAERAGYLAIEPAAVLVTHLQQTAKRHAHELFSLEGLRMLLDQLRQTSPAVVEELVPGRISLAKLHDLLSRLLEEEVPLRPLERILERIAHLPPGCNDTEQMLVPLRSSIGRILCDRFRDEQGTVPLISLNRELSDRLIDVLLEMEEGSGVWLARFVDGLRCWYLEQRQTGRDMPLVVETPIRCRLREVVAHQVPGLAILAYSEVPQDMAVHFCGELSPRLLGLQPQRRTTTRRKTAKATTASPPDLPANPNAVKRPVPR